MFAGNRPKTTGCDFSRCLSIGVVSCIKNGDLVLATAGRVG